MTISGCVQGVGFRPFIFNLAQMHHVHGVVKNTSSGVEIDIEGPIQALSSFEDDLMTKKPRLASYESIKKEPLPLCFFSSFSIEPSTTNTVRSIPLLPDTAICDECKKEFLDPSNRRYQYLFIHCMECGPRFSLFEKMPFDRKNTTMKDFVPCKECTKEYHDRGNRRFFSQTICCKECGPTLILYDKSRHGIKENIDAVIMAKKGLQDGKIVAVKNTGGFLLLCDATNQSAVEQLREIKKRKKKPFAILAWCLDQARSLALVGPAEEKALLSSASPITLCAKKEDCMLAPSVCSESPYVGIMLPSTALLMMISEGLSPLVATSGNISSDPLCIDDQEAFDKLLGCDLFLSHNRRIHNRIDDSVVTIIDHDVSILRMAKGYIPAAFTVDDRNTPSTPILASGCDLKNSFALALNNKIYLSQYIGDIQSTGSLVHYKKTISFWKDLLSIHRHTGACDKHPDMITTRTVVPISTASKSIQHHKAHLLSNQLENNIPYPYLGVVWDGTGLGDDLCIWGGEFFYVTENSIDRIGAIQPFELPGGERAVKEPRRSCLGALHRSNSPILKPWASGIFSNEELTILLQSITAQVNTPQTTSIGRLFDAAASLLGICHINEYEGHAAVKLEKMALQAQRKDKIYSFSFNRKNMFFELNILKILTKMYEDRINKESIEEIAFGFHATLASAIKIIADLLGTSRVALSGGVMQNKLLVELIVKELSTISAQTYIHRSIPTNDQGIAAGQLLCAIGGY